MCHNNIPDLAQASAGSEHLAADKSPVFKVRVCDSIADIEGLKNSWGQIQNRQAHPEFDASLKRYLNVASAFPGRKPYVIEFSSGNNHLIFIGWLLSHRSVLRLGYIKIPVAELSSFDLVYGGIIGLMPDEAIVEVKRYMREHLLHTLDIINFDHVREGGWVHDVLIASFSRRQLHCRVMEKHWKMKLPQSRQAFLTSLSKRHRTKLNSYVKKLHTQFGEVYSVRVYDKIEDIDTIFRDVPAISKKTYQHSLGVGFEDSDSERILVADSLKSGSCRVFVMYIKGQPVSFRHDIIYRDSILSQDIGFDPDWSNYNVGSVLFLESLAINTGTEGVRFYDFGFGDAQYKSRFGESCWNEICCSLASSRTRPLLTILLVKSVDRVDSFLRRIIQRLGIESKIKRAWRNFIKARSVKS